MSKQDEENTGKKLNNKKKEESTKQTLVKVEAPKTRLITAFVMLSGSAFVAIYTYLQHYEIGDWLKTLFIGAVVFLIAGLLLEWIITHFSDLINDRDNAIKTQEDAIAAREADEMAAAEEAQRLAELEEAKAGEQQTNMPNDSTDFGESDEFGGIEDTSEF